MASKKNAPAAAADKTETADKGERKLVKGPSILNKISSKTVIGKVTDVFADDAKDGDEVDLYTVFGVMKGSKTGESDKGEFTALLGQFGAMRVSDGKEFASMKCFLPRTATELAVEALVTLKESGAEKPEVRFAYQIGVRKDSSVAVGYQYTCEPLISEENDAMAMLKQELRKRLPAPASK